MMRPMPALPKTARVLMLSVAALVLAPCAHAEPLVINPFPQKAATTAAPAAVPPANARLDVPSAIETMAQPQEAAMPEAAEEPQYEYVLPVQEPPAPAKKAELPKGVDVPLPDSSYFDPPSETVHAAPMKEPMMEPVRPLASAPPPPMLEPDPVVSDQEPLSVSLDDIGETPVDPEAPITAEGGPPVPYMVQKQRGYVPQDTELNTIGEMPVSEPILKAEAVPISAPEPLPEPVAAPAAPRTGLVYIKDGEIYNTPPPQAAAPVVHQEQVTWADSSAAPQAQMNAPSGPHWSASQGASIREILDGWSAQAGVDLIWDNRSEFAVLQPIELDGNYESAVQTLLDQYQDDQVRPLAKLHQDPDTGARTLVVNVLNGS